MPPFLDDIRRPFNEGSKKVYIVNGKSKALRRKASIKSTRDTYTDSLSVHGLSRIITGSHFERVFWLISSLAVLSFASYLCAIYFITYSKHEIQTDRHTDRMIEMPLPAIMICQHTICYSSKQILRKWNNNYILT